MQFVNYIERLFEKIRESGTSPKFDPWTNQGIRLINKVAVFVSILTFPYVIITYLLGFNIACIIDIFAILYYLFVQRVNSKGYFRASRILLLIHGNTHVLLIALVLGPESGISQYFYAAIIAPLFFFRPEEKKKVLIFVLFTMSLGISYPYLSEAYHPYQNYNNVVRSYIYIPTISGAFISVFSFLFYFYSETFRTQKILDETNKQLQYMGETDFLTKLGNRRKFETVLRMEWSRGMRKKYPVSIILIDIDNFKLYNDLYGHLVGDECLVRVATALNGEIRNNYDFIARYGGEEFIIILHDTASDGAKQVATRMKDAIVKLDIPHPRNHEFGIVTISIGVATMIPEKFHSLMDLIELADQCLYVAKTTGKNKFVSAD